jgi:hypothetical protein
MPITIAARMSARLLGRRDSWQIVVDPEITAQYTLEQ